MITQAAILFAWIGRARSMEGSPFWFEGHPAAGWATDMPGTDHGWSWANNGAFGIQGKQRMYLMEDINAPNWWASKYVRFNLLGKTVTFTADLSGVPCGVAACIYFVALWKPGPGSSYCDIQPNFGGCFEIDLLEANAHAYEASLHTDLGTRTAFDGTCNMNGCSVNIGKYPYTRSGLKTGDLYGPGAKIIDTTRAFQVTASVSEDGYMTVALSQEGRVLPHFNQTEAGNFPGVANQDYWKPERYPKPGGISEAEAAKVVAAMKNGVRLVTSTWTTADTTWLDGTGCNGQPHGDIRGAKVSISGLKVEDTPPAARTLSTSTKPSAPPSPTAQPVMPVQPTQQAPPLQQAPPAQSVPLPAQQPPRVQRVLPPAQPAPPAQPVLPAQAVPPVAPGQAAPAAPPPAANVAFTQQMYTSGQGGFAVTANCFTAVFSITLGAFAALVGFVMLRALHGQGFGGNLIRQFSRSWMAHPATEDAGELLESALATSDGNGANQQ